MWFQLGLQNFIAKKNVNTDSCDIFICDFNRIWHKSLSNNEFLSISKALNPLLEASVQKLKDVTLNLLEGEVGHKEIEEDGSNALLKLRSNIFGLKYRFEVKLKQGDGEMFYKEFTIPVLVLLMKIQTRERKLIKIIQEKDAEITVYKQEYGGTSNFLTTQPFNKKEFDRRESEPSKSFLECIRAKVLSIQAVPQVVKEGQPIIKQPRKRGSADKCEKNESICKDKSSNSSNESRPCVILHTQTVKKRRNHNDGFKIKF